MFCESWLNDYLKYIVDIVILRTIECKEEEYESDISEREFDECEYYGHDYEDLRTVGIIFRFPNGYHVMLEFTAYACLDGTDYSYFGNPDVYMTVNVEMLTKTRDKYTKSTFELEKNEKFPKKRKEYNLSKTEVEEFFKRVMNI